MGEWNEEYPDEPAVPGSYSQLVLLREYDKPERIGVEHLWAVVDVASGGDYGGVDPALRDANIESLVEIAEDAGVDEVDFDVIYGDYGSKSFVLRGSVSNEELFEALRNLEEYPVLDEELHSQKEMDEQEEAWWGWVMDDFESTLEGNFECDLDMSEEKLREIFDKAADRAREYWIMETGGAYIDVSRVADGVTWDDIKNYCERYEDEE